MFWALLLKPEMVKNPVSLPPAFSLSEQLGLSDKHTFCHCKAETTQRMRQHNLSQELGVHAGTADLLQHCGRQPHWEQHLTCLAAAFVSLLCSKPKHVLLKSLQPYTATPSNSLDLSLRDANFSQHRNTEQLWGPSQPSLAFSFSCQVMEQLGTCILSSLGLMDEASHYNGRCLVSEDQEGQYARPVMVWV